MFSKQYPCVLSTVEVTLWLTWGLYVLL